MWTYVTLQKENASLFGPSMQIQSISVTAEERPPLLSLSRLSNLVRLHFTRAYTGEQLTFLTGWFPKLKILSLRDLPNLSRLEIQQGAMVSLEELYLVNLCSMKEVPPGIDFLRPLRQLGFRDNTGEFLTALQECPAIRGRWWYTLRD